MKRIQDWVEFGLVMAFVIACHASKKTQVMLPEFDKEGHRGCRGLMPENTIPAMLKAVDLGVTTLEMDAVITADKKVILSHEPFFSHEISTKPGGELVSAEEEKQLNIYKMRYEEVMRFDVGLRPHPRFPRQEKIKAVKPLLADVFDDVEAYCRLKNGKKLFYNIETKLMPATDGLYHPAPEEFVELLVKQIEDKKLSSRVIIQSFDYRTLRILHRDHPGIMTAALVEDYDRKSFEEQIKALGFHPTIYSPHYSLVNGELVKKCHDLKIRIIPWTVNDKSNIEKLRSMGVDGIITDYPDVFN